MAEDGQFGRFAPEAEPSMADLLDPVALEARLKEARARRAEALARRASPTPGEPATRTAPDESPAFSDATLWRPVPPAPPLPEETSPELPTHRVRPVLFTGQPPAAPARARILPVPEGARIPPLPEQPRIHAAPVPAEIAPARTAPHAPAPVVASPEAPGVRRIPSAAVLFLAGLGLGAAIVAAVVEFRPSPSPLPPVATALPTPAPAPAPATPAPTAPVATATPVQPPAPPSPTAATQEPPARAEPVAGPPAPDTAPNAGRTAPTGLAAPASDAAPPPSASPGALIGPLIAPPPPAPAGAVPLPEAAVPAAATRLPDRITIHYPGSAESQAMAARDALLAAGVTDVETLKVGFAIGRSNIRYYHPEDRGGAEGASALVASRLSGAPETRDFTNYPTPPAVGRIELWLAGEPKGASTPRQTRSAPVAQRPADPYESPEAPQDQVQAVQRILLDRLTGGNP